MKTQFIVDASGNKVAAILPIKVYQTLLEELEDIDDVNAYDKAKRGNQNRVLLSDYLKSRKSKKS